MSVDVYLYSPERNRAVMIGSMGLGGAKSWPVEYGGREFILWMIEELVKDVRVVTENELPDGVEDMSLYSDDNY